MQIWLTLIVVIVVLLAVVRCDVDRASGSIDVPVRLPLPILAEFTGHAATLARLDLPPRAGRPGAGY